MSLLLNSSHNDTSVVFGTSELICYQHNIYWTDRHCCLRCQTVESITIYIRRYYHLLPDVISRETEQWQDKAFWNLIRWVKSMRKTLRLVGLLRAITVPSHLGKFVRTITFNACWWQRSGSKTPRKEFFFPRSLGLGVVCANCCEWSMFGAFDSRFITPPMFSRNFRSGLPGCWKFHFIWLVMTRRIVSAVSET